MGFLKNGLLLGRRKGKMASSNCNCNRNSSGQKIPVSSPQSIDSEHGLNVGWAMAPREYGSQPTAIASNTGHQPGTEQNGQTHDDVISALSSSHVTI
jgi:hypothetical protein